MHDSDTLRRALKLALVQNLESLHRSGVRVIPRPAVPVEPPKPAAAPAVASTVAPAASPDTHPQPAPVSPPVAPVSIEPQSAALLTAPASPSVRSTSLFGADGGFEQAPLPASERLLALQVLSETVAQCTLCRELAAKRTQTVFGVGNPNARLVFFGEAPGADEDQQGEPFVGKAGQLLTKIIEACTLSRDDVYIMNVLKCRPPGNRNPTPEEATCCRPFFEQQLGIIRPEVICCLGSIAATTLLETTESVGRLRGKFHAWRGISVAVTYHPAYLLRTPAAKKSTWEDMKMVMRQLGVEL